MTLSRRQLLASVFAAPVVGVEPKLMATYGPGSAGWGEFESSFGPYKDSAIIWKNLEMGSWVAYDHAGNEVGRGERTNHEKYWNLLLGKEVAP